MAFSRMAPLPGDDTLHQLLATLCAAFFSANRKKGAAPVHPEDFMPWRERRRGRARPTTVDQDAMAVLSRAGAAAKRKKGKA